MNNILAIIPARGGSKGLKDKNIVNFCGKPLIYWTIKAAQNSKYIDKIVVSTDSRKIKRVAEKYNVKIPELRPKKYATNTATTHCVIKHEIKKLEKENYLPDFIVTLQPTSPLRNFKHIDEAIAKMLKNKDADSLVSCIKVPHNYSPESVMQIKNDYLIDTNFSKKKFSRHKKKQFFARNGAAIYITRRRIINKYIFSKKTIPYEMNEFDSIDIDSVIDIYKGTLFANYIKKLQKK